MVLHSTHGHSCAKQDVSENIFCTNSRSPPPGAYMLLFFARHMATLLSVFIFFYWFLQRP